MKRDIKLGLGQMLVEGGEPRRNLKRAIEMIDMAYDENCDILLLPECLDLGWTHPSAKDEATSIPGKWSDMICNAAAKNNIWVCAGLTEQHCNNTYNSVILCDGSKNIILKYRKINILDVGLEYYSVGTFLSVVDTPFGRIGVNICADNYYNSLHIGHTLARMGAEIILSPSSWTVDYSMIIGEDQSYGDKWIEPFTILSKLYNLVICATTSVGTIVGGPFEGKKMIGGSLVVGSSGVLIEGTYNEYAGSLVTKEITIPKRKERGTQIGDMLGSKGYNFESLSDYS